MTEGKILLTVLVILAVGLGFYRLGQLIVIVFRLAKRNKPKRSAAD